MLSVAVISANAQRCYGHHYQQQCGVAYRPQPHCYYNNYNRTSFIDVVIAPKPRVVIASNPQPQMVRVWVEPHWEQGQYGRVWVEGHYIQREVY